MNARRILAVVATIAAVCLVWAPRDMVVQDGFYVKNAPGKEEMAALLSSLETRLKKFLAAAPRDDPRIQRIRQKWSGTLAEIDADAERQGSLAYSLNKDSIHICLRAPDGSLADENTATFVLIHELAHVACVTYGHTPEFWETMKYLLELADALGYYTYVHHGQTPTTLCGHVLGASPLTCIREKTCASALPALSAIPALSGLPAVSPKK